MILNIPISTISLSIAFFSAASMAYGAYKSHLKIKRPFTLYFLVGVVNWAFVAGLLGLGTLFTPRNFELWKYIDATAHIFLANMLAFLFRFILASAKHPREKIYFLTVLIFGQIITLIDFIFPSPPYIVPPGIIIWNNIPVVGVGFGILILIVIPSSIKYFLSKGTEVNELLLRIRFLLFEVFYGFIGLGGILITIFTIPAVVLIGDISMFLGAMAIFLVSLFRFFAKQEVVQ